MTESRPYLIRKVPLPQLAVALLALVGYFVVVVGIMDRRVSPFALGILAVGAYVTWSGSILLRVDAAGVLIGRGFGYAYGDRRPLRAQVPWSSIDEVLVVASGVGEEEVAVRLRDDAPLPWNVKGVIRDPGAPDPVAPELRTSVPPGKLDRPGLAAAVATFGGMPVQDRTSV